MRRTSVSPSLLAAFARGNRILARAVQHSGGAWTAREAVRALHVTRRTLRTWVRDGRIIAVTYRDGRTVYPLAQCFFGSDARHRPRPYPAMHRITGLMRGWMTTEEMFVLLATRQPMLPGSDGEPRTAFGALAVGDVPEVLQMMEWIITPPDAGAPQREAPPGAPVLFSAVRTR